MPNQAPNRTPRDKSTADSTNIKAKTQNKTSHSSKQPQSADDEILDFSKVNYLTVTRQQHDQRVDNFLLSRLKGLPRSHVYNMIRSDEIRVNGKRCKPHDKLERNDIVRIAPVKLATREKPIISAEFAQGLLERVIYEDDGLLVLNKPAGLAVHGGSGESFGVIEAMREATGKKYLELVHRIDKDTSGLLMIAKKRSCLVKLHELLRDHHPYKSYIALGVGAWPDKVRHVKLPLFKYTGAQGEKMVRVTEDGQFAHTVFEVLKPFTLPNTLQAATLVRAVLKTGRTHQIRVHMQAQHCPIAGDERYGDYEVNKKLAKAGLKRMFLHAHQLKFTHPMTNEPVQFTAPLPKALSQFLESISDEKTVSSLNL